MRIPFPVIAQYSGVVGELGWVAAVEGVGLNVWGLPMQIELQRGDIIKTVMHRLKVQV